MKESARKCSRCGRSPADDPTTKLYRFPKPGVTNMHRCESWAQYCYPDKPCTAEFMKNLFSRHLMLCDHHFKPSDFIDLTRKTLHRHAVPGDVNRVVVPIPHVAAGESLPGILDVTSCTPQPGPSHVNRDDTSLVKSQPNPALVSKLNTKQRNLALKCRKNLQKIYKLKHKLDKLKNVDILKALDKNKAVGVLSQFITPTMALMLQGEINNLERKNQGKRWTKEQKITALRLYKRSPSCYNLLRKLICLPAPSSLRKLLRKFSLKVGINKKIFQMLKKFCLNQDQKENEYVLTFDEMSIRKNLQYNNKEDIIEGHQDHGQQGRSLNIASHALVFMICGIRKQLKQPIAFYLSGSSVTADRLAVLIKEVLHHCFEAKINISAMVCDMDGTNRKALGILGATPQDPSIEFGDHKIITLFDPPHLLKCFRNLFMKYNIKHITNVAGQTSEGIAKWCHIQQFFDLDNKNPNFVFAPALRQEHLTPNAKQKMRVKLAAQILSHSVAAGMYCNISTGELTSDAVSTAKLIADMDKLFDCLNSSCPDLRRGKPHATNLTNKTPHLELFRTMKKFFGTLVFEGCRSKPPSVDGWVWTLNGIECFWKNLKARHPTIRSLSTRRLQQDPLENLFGCIRGNCGSNTNPTVGQFIAGLKTAILSTLTSASHNTNCEKDDDQAILNNYKTLLSPDDASTEEELEDCPKDMSILPPLQVCQYISMDRLEKEMEEIDGEMQACAYVSGFVVKSFKDNCACCKKDLWAEQKQIEHIFIEMKEHNEVKTSLKYANKDLIKVVEICANIVNKFLEKESWQCGLKRQILILLNQVDFGFIKCIDHKENIIKTIVENTFYICIKRFCVLKNRIFREEASAQALHKKIQILKNN